MALHVLELLSIIHQIAAMTDTANNADLINHYWSAKANIEDARLA